MSDLAKQNVFQKVSYIGRLQQRDLLLKQTQTISNVQHCQGLYFEAEGGMGKTWLLNNYPSIVEDVLPDIRIARILDFYDFSNRTPDGIERRLIDGLKQIHGEWYRIPADEVEAAFDDYNRVYIGYIRARERGSAGQGEYTPQKLRETFVKCWNALAQQHHLVMSFDTIEALYGVRAPAEAFVSAAEAATGSEQVLGWITTVLPQLQYTLALFSGRPGGRSFAAKLQEYGLLAAPIQVLPALESAGDIQEYIEAYSVEISPDEIAHVVEITEGRPLLLTCFAETRRSEMALPPRLPLPGEATARQAFEAELVQTILNPIQQPDLPESTLVNCLHFLSYARRGIRREDLRALFAELGFDEIDERVIDRLNEVALVKTTHVERSDSAASGTDQAQPESRSEEILLLHDEIHRLIDESGIEDTLGLREDTLAYLERISKIQVRQSRSARPAVLLKAMTDHIYYAMTHNIVNGYRFYVVYVDWLLSEYVVDEALIVSDTFWSILNYTVKRGGKEVQPYRDRLAKIAPYLTYEQIMHDEEVDRVQMWLARGKYKQAAQLAEELYQKYVQQGVLPPEDAELTPDNLPKDPYLFAELSVWLALAIQFSQKTIGAQRAENFTSRLIAFLETPDWIEEEFLYLRRQFFLGHAYFNRGYLRRQQQRFAEAIADYEKGRAAFRAYRDEQIEVAGQKTTLETLLNDHITNDLAQVTNNLAFALSLIGNLKRALRQSDEVIKQYVPFSSDYQKALFYNANGRIRIALNDLQGAEASIMRAEQVAKESGSIRARGLVSRAHGQLERARMVAQGEPDTTIEVHYQTAEQLLEAEPDTLREVYYDWAGFLRDVAVLYRAVEQPREASTYEQRALEMLDRALKELSEGTSMQRADYLESKVVLYRIMDEYQQAIALLNQAEAMMSLPMPEYGQCVSGKIALQRGLVALYGDKNPTEALRLMAIALARAYVFAKEHHDQSVFERVIRQHIQQVPVENLRAFKQATESENLYILADDLPYQQPDAAKWADAWEDSIAYINDLISEVRLPKYP